MKLTTNLVLALLLLVYSCKKEDAEPEIKGVQYGTFTSCIPEKNGSGTISTKLTINDTTLVSIVTEITTNPSDTQTSGSSSRYYQIQTDSGLVFKVVYMPNYFIYYKYENISKSQIKLGGVAYCR